MKVDFLNVHNGVTGVCGGGFKPLARGIAVACVLTLGGLTGAKADVVTWNPAGAGLAGTPFTFDTLHLADYARIHVTNVLGDFVENGFLNVTGAHGGTTDYTPPGLLTAYSLYIAFNATGNSSAPDFNTAGNFGGLFQTLNYSLYGVTSPATFSVSGGIPAVSYTGTQVLLGTGSLIDGANSLSVLNGTSAAGNHSIGTTKKISPSAAPLDMFFVPNPLYSSFFAVPPATSNLTFSSAFTNNFLKVELIDPTTITINAGGGDASVTIVPEPASIAMLGIGLLGLGVIAMRRKSA